MVAAVLAACYLSSGSWRCFSRVLHQNSCLPGFPQKASGFREGERGCGSTHAQSELYKTSQPQFTEERRTFTSSTDSGKSHSSKIQRNSQRSPRLGRNNALQHFGLANAPNSCSFFQPSPFFLHLSFPNSDVFLVSFHTQPVHFRFHSFHVFPQPTAEKVCIMHSFQNKISRSRLPSSSGRTPQSSNILSLSMFHGPFWDHETSSLKCVPQFFLPSW